MIVYTKGRTPDSLQEFRAPGTHDELDLPLVVLINRGSASASEIVAGAIQDHDRGLVVGETSWGKGLVQSVYTLQYGAGLALTTSKYYTPSGRNIQRDYISVYDYYLADLGEKPAETPVESREVFKTELGRKVYGGGGITPDVVVEPRELPRTLQILEVRSAIFNFAVDYAARHPELTQGPRHHSRDRRGVRRLRRLERHRPAERGEGGDLAGRRPGVARARDQSGDRRREIRLRRFVSVPPPGRRSGRQGAPDVPGSREARVERGGPPPRSDRARARGPPRRARARRRICRTISSRESRQEKGGRRVDPAARRRCGAALDSSPCLHPEDFFFLTVESRR